MELFESLKQKIHGKELKIVFPEATDERILGAAVRLQSEKILNPILLGNKDEVMKAAKDHGFDLGTIEIVDPQTYDKYDEMVTAFVERRKGKATQEQAQEQLRDVTSAVQRHSTCPSSWAWVSSSASSTSSSISSST